MKDKDRGSPTYSLLCLIFSDPFLFSKRPSFHRRFLLPLRHCFYFLRPVSLSIALPVSSFFLFSLITVSFSLLRYLSPSLSLRSPPVLPMHCSSFLTLRGRPCTNDGSCSGHGPALPETNTETCRAAWKVVRRSRRSPPSISSCPSFSLLNLALVLSPYLMTKGTEEESVMEWTREKGERRKEENEHGTRKEGELERG